MLIKAKQNGDPPPAELTPWIESMSRSLSDRLIELGLLSLSRRDRAKPLSDLITDFGKIVAGRKSNKAIHASQQEAKVRRVYEELKASRVEDVTDQMLTAYLKTCEYATSTRRSYIIAMKDFGSEMKRLGVVKENPFEHTKAPGQYEAPEAAWTFAIKVGPS
jgi:hypothetical protein